MNYHVEEIIKKQGIPTGRVIIILGAQGSGKTSFATALLRADYFKHGFRRKSEAIVHYKARGLDLARLPNKDALKTHLYYSNVEIALKGSLSSVDEEFKTHNITADDICLPDGEHPAVYFPWGSVIFIQEASDKWYSHDWQTLAKRIRPWLKYLRQSNLTLILDTHNDSDIAKQLRELATDELYVDSHYFKPARFFGLIKPRSTWYFNWSYPQSIRAAERRNGNIRAYAQDVSFRMKGSVYNAYDSYSGEMLFLRGVYDYGFAISNHPKIDYTSADSIEQYCSHNEITASTGEVAKSSQEQEKPSG